MLSKLRKISPILTIIFISYFIFILFKVLSHLNLYEVLDSLYLLNPEIIIKTLLVSICTYCVFVLFDQLSMLYINSHVSRFKVSGVALLSYILNLNFGALLGSIGVRYRLYKKIGVHPLKIHLIVIFSSASNWLAYLLLLGLITLISPTGYLTSFSPDLMKLLAMSGLVIILLYLIACFKGLSLNIKKSHFHFPKLQLGVLQLVLGSTQWCLQALMIYSLFRFFNIPSHFVDVLSIFLLAAIAGALTHIPSGLGVLEAVFLNLMPQNYHPQVLASLVCFRAIFYLIPLGFALPTYLFIESKTLLQSTNQH